MVDLDDCDKEPIHIPGSIQGYGALVVCQSQTLRIVQVSGNTSEFLGIEPQELLPHNLSEIMSEANFEKLVQATASLREQADSSVAQVSMLNRQLNVVCHLCADQTIFEFEPISSTGKEITQARWAEVSDLVEMVSAEQDLAQMLTVACSSVKRWTNFDRVMIYKFHEDGHGEVVAEEKNPELDAWLHQHYPASDIPAQARALYLKNWIRLIANVNYEAVPLIPAVQTITGKPEEAGWKPTLHEAALHEPALREALDMTYIGLRSVSAIHVEYLQNMNVSASMSMSLIVDDKLWGLIACHNSSPSFVNYDERKCCEQVARFLSYAISTNEEQDRFLKERDCYLLAKQMLKGPVESQSCGLIAHDALMCIGTDRYVSDPIAIGEQALVSDWLSSFTAPLVCLESLCETAPVTIVKALEPFAGLLAIRLTDGWLAFLRLEHARTVTWGGDKNEQAQNESERLHPRVSFSAWKEAVKDRCMPWHWLDIEFAVLLQRVLAGELGLTDLLLTLGNESARRREVMLKLMESMKPHG